MAWDGTLAVVTYKLSLNTSAIIISHMSYAVACFRLNTSRPIVDTLCAVCLPSEGPHNRYTLYCWIQESATAWHRCF